MYYEAVIGPTGAIAASAGILTSSVVVIMMCVCCRKRSAMPEHKATVIQNVLAEDSSKVFYRNKNRVSITRPESAKFEKRVSIGTGRWDDLANADEVIDVIPAQFRPKQSYKPPNPPDVILHPTCRTTSHADPAPVPIRQRSTVVQGPPIHRRSLLTHNYSSVRTDTSNRPQSEFPLGSFHLKHEHNSPEVVYENSAQYKQNITNRNTRRPSRERILSHQVPPTQEIDRSRVRGGTPSDPGNLKGIAHNEDYGKPPPIPDRKYLEEEPEPIIVKTSSSWGQRHNGVTEESVKVHDTNKELHELPGYTEANDYPPTFSPPLPPRTPVFSPPRREPPHPPNEPKHEPPQPPSPNVQITQRHPSNSPNGVHNRLFYINEAHDRGMSHDIHPTVRNHHSTGSDTPMYGQDHPQLPPKMRRYVNVTDHIRRYQPSAQEIQNRFNNGDMYAPTHFPDERQHQMRQRPMNPRIDDIRRQNDMQIPANYDPRMGFLPGAYIRPKTYYQQPDSNKRFSDGSDYSDSPWRNPIENSYYYGDPNEYNPYFFRSRWSIITDSGAEEYYARRSNSNADDYVQVRNRLPQNYRRGSGDLQRQHWRRSGVELPETKVNNHQPMVVKEYPMTRSHGGQNNQNSGDNNKQRTTTEEKPTIIKPIPRRIAPQASLTKHRLSEPENLLDALYKYREELNKQGSNQVDQKNEKLDQNQQREILRKQLFSDSTLTKNIPLVIEALISICESEGGSWQRQAGDSGNNKRPKSLMNMKSCEENQSSQPQGQSLRPDGNESKDKPPVSSSEQKAAPCDKVTTNREWNPNKRRRHHYEEVDAPKSAPPTNSSEKFNFSEYDMAVDPSIPPIPPPRLKKIAKAKLEAETDDGASKANPEPSFQRRRSTYSGSRPCLQLTENEMKWLAKSSGQNIQISEPPVEEIKVQEDTSEVKPENPMSPRTKWEAFKTKLVKTKSEPLDKMKIEKMESGESVNHFFVCPYESGSRSATSSPSFIMVRGNGSPTFGEVKPRHRRPPPPEPPKEKVCTFDDIVVDDTMDAEDVIKAIEKKMSTSQEGAEDSIQDGTMGSKYNSLTRTSDTTSSRGSYILPPTPPTRQLERSDGHRSTNSSPSHDSPINWSQKQFHTPPRSNSPQRKNIAPALGVQPPQRKSTASPRVPIRRQSLSPHHKFPVFPTPPPSPIPVSPLVTSAPSTPKGSNVLSTTSPITPYIRNQFKSVGHYSFHVKNNPRQQRSKLTVNHASSAPTSPKIGANLKPTKTSSRFAPKLPFYGPRFSQSTSEEDVTRKMKSGRTDLSRTGEVIHIPAEGEYAVPFDCLDKTRNFSRPKSNDVSRQNSGASSSGISSLEQHEPLPNVFSPVFSPKGKHISPSIEFTHSDNSRFYPIREESNSPILFRMSDSDDYDYAIPVNSPLRRSKSENILETAM